MTDQHFDFKTPADLGLPHESFRPGQRETIERIFGMESGQALALEAPTGSGKTAYVSAAGAAGKFRDSGGSDTVTVLTKTKLLQTENYGGGYGFDVLLGKSNYTCAIDRSLNCAECKWSEQGIKNCPKYEACPYYRQKEIVRGSGYQSLNYAYWLTSGWISNPRGYLFLDEAHLLPDIVLEHAGITITETERADWKLPPFPNISTGGQMILKADGAASSTGRALEWLTAAREILVAAYNALRRDDARDAKKALARCEKLGKKVKATIDALMATGADWYIRSGLNARTDRGRIVPGFICRPLTARHHTRRYFTGNFRLVAMSATIGDPAVYSAELGIPMDSWAVESQWKPETRPVYYFKNGPRLGQAAKAEGPAAYELQADLIARAIRAVDNSWSGVVHTTSKTEARNLAERLGRRLGGDRVWIVPEVGTDQQMTAWEEYKAAVPNALAVSWSWAEGVNLRNERICVIAKTPFPSLGDPYERERQMYDGKFYLQRTAWQMEQAAGRTRRGEPDDYDTPGGDRRGLVIIADQNWKRVQKYLSPGFTASLVELG